MSKTLFWYIFKDLLRIFLLTSGAIAGIMSFGGLLRPLTQQGLDPSQMFQMLGYFMPAMTNYSWPVAALFSTTFVYGRLASDNELLAMRATGVGWGSIMFPAFLLSFVIALASLAMMLYVVPDSFLRAEKVVYSNLAQLVANQIDRNRKINFNAQSNDITISASSAHVETRPDKPRDQVVVLNNVTIVQYLNAENQNEPKKPKDFFVAASAEAHIEMPQSDDGDVLLSLVLTNGARFPADESETDKKEISVAIGQTNVEPYPLPSPVHETARFMTFDRLLAIREHPEMSRRVSKMLTIFRRQDQQQTYLTELRAGLTATNQVKLGKGRVITITRDAEIPKFNGEKLVLIGGTADDPKLLYHEEGGDPSDPHVEPPLSAKARQMTISAFPDMENKQLILGIDLTDAIILDEKTPGARQAIHRQVIVDMDEKILAKNNNDADYYLSSHPLPGTEGARDRLRGAYYHQINNVEAELNVRFSFSLACLILINVGAVIGAMFRSGNFVSAFALSTVPALISLMLIMTGQHMAENVPEIIKADAHFNDPLGTGLWVIWSGNIAVGLIGLMMFMKQRRT